MNEEKATTQTLRKFGLIWALVFSIVAFYPLMSSNPIRLWSVFVSIGFVIAGLAYPIVLNPFFGIWMKFGKIAGSINAKIILALIFYFVVTPIGLIRRAMGKDSLKKRLDKGATTYWEDRVVQPTSMEKQF